MTTTPALAGPLHTPERESPLGITSYLDKAVGAVQDAARFAHIKLVTGLTTPENNTVDGGPRRMGNFMLSAMNRVAESPFGISVVGATCARIALNTVHAYGQIRHGTDLGIHQDGPGNHAQYTLVDYNLDSTSGPKHNSDMDGDGDVDATDTRIQYENTANNDNGTTSEPWPVPRTDKTGNRTVDLEVPAPTYYDNTEDEERSRANGQTVLSGLLCSLVVGAAAFGAGWMARRNRYMEIARRAQEEKEEKKAHNEESSPAKTEEKAPEELIGEGAAPGDDYPSMRSESGAVGGLRWDGETTDGRR